jgi:endonuclease YncB( thermonuclease family)
MSVNFSKRALVNSALFICLLGFQSLGFGPATIGAAWADDPYWARVKYVIDGDTVVLDDDVRVRLIGINAPEKKSDSKAAEPFSLEAQLLLQSLVLGKKVRVIRGIEPFDKYRRSLAYLELEDGTDVQESLLEVVMFLLWPYHRIFEELNNFEKANTLLVATTEVFGVCRNLFLRPSLRIKTFPKVLILCVQRYL